jgi:membrane protease YdiL (CAAX protease family)
MANRNLTILVLIFLLVGWPLFSYMLMQQGGDKLIDLKIENISWQVYVPTIIIQWLIFFLIILVLLKGQEKLSSIGWTFFNWQNFLIGLGFFGVANLFLLMVSQILNLFHLSVEKDISLLLPKSSTEKLVWVFMSISAGVCEETGFRGYVLTKLNSFTKNWLATVIISSVFFGLGHFYQGWGGVILTGIYGALFCFLFIWRKSLVPGIFAHILQDISALFFT